MSEQVERTGSGPADVELIVAAAEVALPGKFDVSRLTLGSVFGFRLSPHRTGTASVDVFVENDWLRVVGEWGTGIDEEFDVGDARSRVARASQLIISIGRFGVARIRPRTLLGSRRTLIFESEEQVDSVSRKYGWRLIRVWKPW